MVKNTLFALAVTALMIVGIVPVVGEIAPGYEGRNYPVAGPLVIVEVIKEEDGWTHFSMAGPKLRECHWKRTSWFLGTRDGGHVPTGFEHLGRPTIREAGEQFWPESRVRMSPEDLLNNSFSNSTHDCGGFRWWYVVTPLYP